MSPAPRGPRPYEFLRKLFHLVVVVVGWVGFVWLWLLVVSRPWESQGLTWLIVASTVVVPVITGAWVLHNRSLYRRKGERQSVAVVDMKYSYNWYGREVRADWPVLRCSRAVIVEVDRGQKRYLAGTRIDEPLGKPQATSHSLGDVDSAMPDAPLE
ncbi:MAG: hypothetical protein WCJ87_08485 [Burkholderiales bacterium]